MNKPSQLLLTCLFKFFSGVIDDFIELADLNKDGLLNYAEYNYALNSENRQSKSPVSSEETSETID